jgi:amidase
MLTRSHAHKGSAMLHLLSASELAQRIRNREVSAVEVLNDHLRQIERCNPRVNAIVTLVAEQALAQAHAADAARSRGKELGALHGIPVAHKDLALTKGIRTTFGSPLFRDHIPDQNSLIVERIQQAGAITLGKTNTPEFGAGSQTFNQVFGATRNPYDHSKTCGGSSGGAAVALACHMIALADGSDMGGSLRNPAGYCNVVGLRPSPGRVPIWPDEHNSWQSLSVEGPMARTVQDVALLLSVIAGPDPRVPNSISEPGAIYTRPLERNFRGVRIAWSPTLGGLAIDPRTQAVLAAQLPFFTQLGIDIEEATPDFSGADQAFKTLRAWSFAMSKAETLAAHRDQLKDTVIWNIEAGLALSGNDIAQAVRLQTQLFNKMHTFMQQYEYLICPVSQVPPFPIEQPYVTEINGQPQTTYIDWMRSCYYISATGHPAISVPAGFTPDGLPVGIQIVGRYRDEFGVLQLAHAFEQATGYGTIRPQCI